MTVSVVIPVHNKAPYLAECLSSVWAQTYPVLEVIAVDDASTDESAAILGASTDTRLRVVQLPRNVGPGLAAQHGMDQAQGELIVRMDADDVMMPDRIARQVTFMHAHPAVDACGMSLALLHDMDIVRNGPPDHDAIFAQLVFGVGMYQPTMAVRRSALTRTGLRYKADWPYYGEDRLYQLEAVRRGLRLANLNDVGLLYREGRQNTVHGRDRWADHRALHTRVLTALGHPIPAEGSLMVHSYGARYFPQPPDAAGVRAFKAWLEHLEQWAARSGILPMGPFRSRLRTAWEELFHYLPEQGLDVVWEYWRSGGRITMARVYYSLRVWMRRQSRQRNT